MDLLLSRVFLLVAFVRLLFDVGSLEVIFGLLICSGLFSIADSVREVKKSISERKDS